jgi:ABC-type transport system substrate-binding protein
VDEPTTKLAALTSGELDFAGINPAHAEFVRRDPQLMVLDYPLLFGYTLIFNTRRAPFNSLAARRAVAAAIDRQAIVDGVLFGFGTPSSNPLPPELQRSMPALAPSPPMASRAAVPPFELLTVGSGEAALEQMLQAQWAQAGIHAEIRQLELATYLDRIQGPSHDFDVAVMGVSGDVALGYLSRLVSLSGLHADGSGEKLLQVIEDSLPAVYLYHSRGVQGINRRVQGVQMDMRGELATLTQWWVKEP